MLYSSPRDLPDIQVALFEKLQCKILFKPEETSETTRNVHGKRTMVKYFLPDPDYFFAQQVFEPYPYNKTFEEASMDQYVLLHSSGWTGMPKVLILMQGPEAAHDA